jgi:hypothetical protein
MTVLKLFWRIFSRRWSLNYFDIQNRLENVAEATVLLIQYFFWLGILKIKGG